MTANDGLFVYVYYRMHNFLMLFQLLDACVSNCGNNFHLEMASREFESECRTLLSAGKVNE